MNYRLGCSCGYYIYRGAPTREEALEKFRAIFTQEVLDQHFSQNHAGEQKPTLADFHARLDQMVTEANSNVMPAGQPA